MQIMQPIPVPAQLVASAYVQPAVQLQPVKTATTPIANRFVEPDAKGEQSQDIQDKKSRKARTPAHRGQNVDMTV